MANEYFKRCQFYEEQLSVLIPQLAHGAFHGSDKQTDLWRDAIRELTNIEQQAGGNPAFIGPRLYPACILYFAARIVATVRANYATLYRLFRAPCIYSTKC